MVMTTEQERHQQRWQSRARRVPSLLVLVIAAASLRLANHAACFPVAQGRRAAAYGLTLGWTAVQSPLPADALSRGEKLPDDLKTITLATGLRYTDVRVGEGPIVKAGTRVTIDYVMAAARGRFGFSTIDRTKDHETPFTFVVGDPQVIAGLSDGIYGMQAGGIRRLVIPASLTYMDESKLPSPSDFSNYQVFKNYYLNPNMNPVPELILDVKLFKFSGGE
mmetsp:Transcript_7482/g.16378  ORF Transcript_7482/g.16378 Transcript_7482/m.16378 type:complete len:221 (-) Transcript_7482:108-770(-)